MPAEIIHGNIRVQLLNNSLIRLEQKGPNGFEDRKTFTVVNRETLNVNFNIEEQKDVIIVTTDHLLITLPSKSELKGTTVKSKSGKVFFEYGELPPNSYLPAPSELPEAWIMVDTPRMVPPEWGATPQPEDSDSPTSGWDISNNAPDIYIFLAKQSGYTAFKKSFLKLTGSIPMPPLYSFGLFHSRYYAYSEESALNVIDTYREKGIPFDVFVVDTDWRVGASKGYGVNTNLFPDMKRFIDTAHSKNVKIMFNDHPEPQYEEALDPKELQFRWEGLTSQFKNGLDGWWFDRNWVTHLKEPLGLKKEVWGMALFWDITQRYYQNRRPFIMSNVHGIDNGKLNYPSHPAAHRYPIWWTGDTHAKWLDLKSGIQNGIDCGVNLLLPYINEDLGGHQGQPSAELYVRYLQFGCFSPATRPHCTQGQDLITRYLWAFGENVEKIVSDYIRLRYRLIPLIYTAARKAYNNGTPLMRRCDLNWPEEVNAKSNLQYMFGDDLLVAPVYDSAEESSACKSETNCLETDGVRSERPLWIPPGFWRDLWSGETLVGPRVINVKPALNQMPMYVRDGGIVLSVPQMQHTKSASWEKVIVDAYLSEKDDIQQRSLYEDDGMSNGYQKDECAVTKVRLSTRQNKSELEIGSITGKYDGILKKRSWIIRLHLSNNDIPKEISINDKSFSTADSGLIRILSPSSEFVSIPLLGEGAVDGKQGNPVIEIKLQDQDTNKPIIIQCRLK